MLPAGQARKGSNCCLKESMQHTLFPVTSHEVMGSVGRRSPSAARMNSFNHTAPSLFAAASPLCCWQPSLHKLAALRRCLVLQLPGGLATRMQLYAAQPGPPLWQWQTVSASDCPPKPQQQRQQALEESLVTSRQDATSQDISGRPSEVR